MEVWTAASACADMVADHDLIDVVKSDGRVPEKTS